jgi:hypothetical protein
MELVEPEQKKNKPVVPRPIMRFVGLELRPDPLLAKP